MITILLKTIVQESILKSKLFLLRQNNVIKGIEYIRGIYKYPRYMMGRRFNLNTIKNNTDVLVIAAHPDDEVLGLSTTLYRHGLEGKNIVVVFVTNGSGDSWKQSKKKSMNISNIRYNEALQALSMINISRSNIFSLGYPDQGTHRYLKNIAMDIDFLMKRICPKIVYTHCIEGGHNDHDMTSFVVKTICKKIGYENIYEWTEYNPKQPIGARNVVFLPSSKETYEEITIDISDGERELKKKMLSFHESQDVEKFYYQGEALRKVSFSSIENELENFCALPRKNLNSIVENFLNAIEIIKK